MIDRDQLNEAQDRLLGQAVSAVVIWGRELREALRNAVYEGVIPEEGGIAVYGKYKRGALAPEDKTPLEYDSWLVESKRRILELLVGFRDLQEGYERLNNANSKCEHHSLLVDAIGDMIWDTLSATEQETFIELLQSCRWRRGELEQAKESVETAEWFNELEP